MNLLGALLLTTVATSTPLIFAALGGVLSEKSGVTNIGIEGMILVGAFAGMVGSYYTGNPWIGVLSASVAGGLLALIHAFISISGGGNQAVSAAGLILFAQGITSFGIRVMFGRAGNSDTVNFLPNTNILKNIPLIGNILSRFSPLVYLAVILAIVIYYIIYKTPLGIHIVTVGENPKVAESLGINVWRIRYVNVVASGLIAGLAGAYLSLGQMNMFQEGMSDGRGFLALAAVIMGRWKPHLAVLAALFFGFFDALALQLQMMPNIKIPYEFIQTIPYIACLIVLASAKTKGKGPASNGKPYLKRR